MRSFRALLMLKLGLLFVVLAAGVARPPKAEAAAPVFMSAVKWLGEKLFGWGMDKLWDATTGKPDLNAIDQRLATLEKDAASRDTQIVNNIRWLREQMTANTTLPDYFKLAKETTDQLTRRVEALESRGEATSREVQELKANVASQARGMEDRVARLEGRVGQIERDINGLKPDPTKYPAHKRALKELLERE